MSGKQASKPKKSLTPATEEFPRKAIPCPGSENNVTAGRNFARVLTSPETAAYRVIHAFEQKDLAEQIDVPGMLELFRDQASTVSGGDLSQVEAMLLNQATALQTLFAQLAITSRNADMLPQQEVAMRLALKAQAQCRATLETLAAIKNPPLVYAQQANLTTGPQQINNGEAVPSRSRAREIRNEQSKLLDTGKAGTTIPSHSSLETLGKVDRAKVGRRQG